MINYVRADIFCSGDQNRLWIIFQLLYTPPIVLYDNFASILHVRHSFSTILGLALGCLEVEEDLAEMDGPKGGDACIFFASISGAPHLILDHAASQIDVNSNLL